MPDDFDAIERRFGGKGTATAPPSDFAAIEERFGKPASSDAVTAYATTPTTGGPKPWELDKPDTSTSFGESFAQGAMNAARDLPFKVVEAGMRLFGQDVDLTHAGKIADMTLGGPSVGESMAEERRLREGNLAGYGLGGTALDTAAMVATGGAATSGLRAAVPWLARAAESASPLIRAAGTTAEAGAVGAGMGAAMNPKDMAGGAESGALFMALAGNASRLIAGANPGAVRAVLAESGAMPLAGVGTRLATEGRVGDWREFLTDVGVGLVFGAAKAPEAGRARVRALVEESIKNNQTFDEFKASFGTKSIEEIKASVGRTEVPPPVSSLPGVEPAILEVPEGPRLKTGPTGPEVLAEVEANRVGLKSGVPSKPLEGPPKDRIAWAPSEPVDTSPIAPEPASAGGKAPEFQPARGVSPESEVNPKDTQRGMAVLPSPDDIVGVRDRAKKVLDVLATPFKRTGEFFRGRGLERTHESYPEMADVMARGANQDVRSGAQADLTTLDAMKPIEAMPKGRRLLEQEKFDYASAEHEFRSTGHSQRGSVPAFDRLFPTEEALQSYYASDLGQALAKSSKEAFQRDVEKGNISAGASQPEYAGKGRPWREGMGKGEWVDFRTNMVPLSAEAADALAKTGRAGPIGVSGGSSMQTPINPRTRVASQFTGGGEAYDVRLRERFRRGLWESGRSLDKRAVLDAGLSSGGLVRGKENAPRGWRYVGQETPSGLNVAAPEEAGATDIGAAPQENGGIYADPRVYRELRTWHGSDAIPAGEGVFSKGVGAATAAAITGPLDAVIHGMNLSGVAFTNGISPVELATKFASYSDPRVRATEALRQAKWGGARAPHDTATILRRIFPAGDAALHATGEALHRLDLAVRSSILDAVEARIAKGEVPDTLEARRNAMLRAGNYQNMTQDVLTRVLKKWFNPFIVAGKTMTANAYGSSVLGGFSQGIEATSVKSALKLRGAVLIRWAAFAGAVGAWNYSQTGYFQPPGTQLGQIVVGPKNADGSYPVNDGPARMTGFAQSRDFTGLGTAEEAVKEGWDAKRAVGAVADKAFGRGVRAMVGGPLAEAYSEMAGGNPFHPHITPKSALKASEGLNPIVEAILRAVDPGTDRSAWESTIGPLYNTKGKAAKDVNRMRSAPQTRK